MPKFSVIIPTYNCAEYLAESLNSVLSQTFDDYEVVIVDDGSTDNTRDVLKPYRDHGKVRYIYQANQGLASARNAGIRHAVGQFIALLDADDLWTPDKLHKQAKILDESPGIALLCSNAYLFYEHDVDHAHVLHRSLPSGQLATSDLFQMIMTGENPIVCPTVVMAAWVFREVGLYDEQLSRLGCEDRDMSLRIAAKYEAHYMRECLAYYRIRGNAMHRNTDRMFQARMYVLKKVIRENPRVMHDHRLRRLAHGNIYRFAASGHLAARRLRKAMMNYLVACRYDPIRGAKGFPAFLFRWLTGIAAPRVPDNARNRART